MMTNRVIDENEIDQVLRENARRLRKKLDEQRNAVIEECAQIAETLILSARKPDAHELRCAIAAKIRALETKDPS